MLRATWPRWQICPSAFVFRALGLRPSQDMLPQEGHASSSLCYVPEKQNSPTVPSPLSEAAGPALRDPCSPLSQTGMLGSAPGLKVATCFLPGTTPSHQARGPVAISPSSEETRPPLAVPHDSPAPGQVLDAYRTCMHGQLPLLLCRSHRKNTAEPLKMFIDPSGQPGTTEPSGQAEQAHGRPPAGTP